jgi:class 3 adenylate cyclase
MSSSARSSSCCSRATPEPDRVLATVLFTDIVDSTRRAAEVGDAAWRRLLEQHDELVREQVAKAGGRVVKSLGDGILAVFTGPARTIACAQALVSGVAELDLSLRAGVHTSECEVLGDDLGGMAVHIGARVGARAEPGQILVSKSVVDLVVGSDGPTASPSGEKPRSASARSRSSSSRSGRRRILSSGGGPADRCRVDELLAVHAEHQAAGRKRLELVAAAGIAAAVVPPIDLGQSLGPGVQRTLDHRPVGRHVVSVLVMSCPFCSKDEAFRPQLGACTEVYGIGCRAMHPYTAHAAPNPAPSSPRCEVSSVIEATAAERCERPQRLIALDRSTVQTPNLRTFDAESSAICENNRSRGVPTHESPKPTRTRNPHPRRHDR